MIKLIGVLWSAPLFAVGVDGDGLCPWGKKCHESRVLCG